MNDICKQLKAFTTDSLFEASESLLDSLGIRTATNTKRPIPFAKLYEKAAKAAGADVPIEIGKLFDRIAEAYFIGVVDKESIGGQSPSVDFDSVKNSKYDGMFVFAMAVKDSKRLTRTEASILTRGVNRLAKQNPATLILLEGGHLSIATCERTTYQHKWRPGEKLGKVSVLKDIDCLKPHRGHIDILESMDVSGCKSFDELYGHWQDVFSAKLLTKQFYREIQNWYFWALKQEQHVSFPNALDNDKDDAAYNKENLIRLITRLVFTWFMKAKGLVNPDLFDAAFLAKALKHFDAEGAMDDPAAKDADKSCTFYRAILQNLFFATFNQEIRDRGFVDRKMLDAKHFNIKNYYRNAQLFTEKDSEKIIAYFNGSPFVNGGLFECLDNVEQNGKVYSWDGFSNNVRFKNGSLKSALIPDRLFFGSERTTDLSEFFEKDKAAKSVKVRGIVNILNDYVFTIEENTPLDEDVALDPELLGKVFENLLGCYNPETQQMARNATGSFYTPREIVNYMVRVSLKAYLKRACPNVMVDEIDALVDGTAEVDAMPSVKANAHDILIALFKAKILDPACGSGAFPMGTLTAMVEILRKIDPDNRHWYKIVLDESLKEAESVAEVGDAKEREELKAQIEYDFKKRVDFPDYARKLYVIEHCIFGSDIQPIAVQISRLRFFITLLCEQAKSNDPAKNYGITPLPNLENNFVAANSLLSIDLKDMRELLGQKKIVALVKQLRATRHQLFLPKTSDKKKRLQREDEKLRGDIAKAAEGLYDENVGQKIKLHEAEIARCEELLSKLSPDDFKDALKSVEETDLFGNKTVTMKKVVGRGNEIKKCRDDHADAIVAFKNASRKERLLADLKRLVAWNPFAFNVAESFLDPEWMFGVKDGFNIVIGNPPYIQLQSNHGELGNAYKDCGFKTFARTGDIYSLFYERGWQLLNAAGCLCFITSNKWMRAGYGEATRQFFAENTNPLLLIDFAGEKIFESATVDTNILLFDKEKNKGKTLACIGGPDCRNDLSDFVKHNATPCSFASSDSWVILSPIEQSIKRKIEAVGIPLKNWDIQINYGIKTGCNEAFIITTEKRDEILANCSTKDERKRTAELIRPILRGRDIKRYGYEWAGLYLIATHNGYSNVPRINIDDYPAVKQWLDEGGIAYNGNPYAGYKQIARRADKGETPYNLRNCAYMDDFSKPKIVWGEISDRAKFALDSAGGYCMEATTFLLTGDCLCFLTCYLNSSLAEYLFSKIGTTTGVGTVRWKKFKIEELCVPTVSKSVEEKFNTLIKQASNNIMSEKIDQMIFELCDLSVAEIDYVRKHCFQRH